jgi:hypothetical protein
MSIPGENGDFGFIAGEDAHPLSSLFMEPNLRQQNVFEKNK